MEYVEQEPPSCLAGHIQCLWRLRDDEPDGAVETIYPDGRCEFIVHLGTPMARHEGDAPPVRQASVLFAGQLTQAIRLSAHGPLDCIGVRIRPEASACMAGTSVADFRERVVDLTAVDSKLAEALSSHAAAFAKCGDRGPLEALLADRCRGAPVDPAIARVVERIDQAAGQVAIVELAEIAGLGTRSLQARFLAAVGLTAKAYARIRRLQATIDALDESEDALASVAADRGFADQAHATREVAHITGLPPARLRTALREARDDEGTVRLAAAFVRGTAG